MELPPNKDSWKLAEPAKGLSILTDLTGVRLVSETLDLADQASWRQMVPYTRLGRCLPSLLVQLREMDLATVENGEVRIPYETFSALEEIGVDAFDGVVPWSPFTIELSSRGWLGADHFRCFVSYYLGGQKVALARQGCFVKRGQNVYRLDRQQYLLLDAIDSFASVPAEKRAGTSVLPAFAQIRGLAEETGVLLDTYLSKERVLMPAKIGLDLKHDDQGRVTFLPSIDGVDDESFAKEYLALDDVESVYSIPTADGGRLRILLSEPQRDVLLRMQRVRHVSGADRTKVLRDPLAVFDGVADFVQFDAAEFGPRVKGVGDFPFVVQPYIYGAQSGIFEDPPNPGRPVKRSFEAGLECRYVDGSVERVKFASQLQVHELYASAKQAELAGLGEVIFAGKSILLDEPFLRALGELASKIITRNGPKVEPDAPSTRRYVLIYTNEANLEYNEDFETAGAAGSFEPPAALRPTIDLKPHQEEGTAWMQRCFRIGRKGCLLADDMGLGKTLQILAFLAWLIEKGELGGCVSASSDGPWDPILIVAPIILLENEVWTGDMRSFFDGDGAIFRPWLILHGNTIKSFRRPDLAGQETKLGEPVLDLARLREYRVILTNYDTLTNYQHSFARMRDHLTVVVTDEAQEHKTPNTKISHALKALSPRFRIASTGTPVENRLLDLWNHFDYLQPGALLGTAAEFTKTYEKPVADNDNELSSKALADLKSQLQYGKPTAYVLRREKSLLPNFPKKHEHYLDCVLSERQRGLDRDLIGRARSGEPGSHPFALISYLMRLHQHPFLVPSYQPDLPEAAISASPKLAAVLNCLGEIRRRREKALVFTRSLDMQQLLADVFRHRFSLEVSIVNGETRRSGGSKFGSQTRHSMISAFRESEGFDILILSPDVAGMGLTLVEANHVIHYGRWWNPAKESQATDRVYRIGQKRDVHVYYPIAKDPEGEFQTFDERLNSLIQRRRDLATEFLAPPPGESTMEEELLKDLLGETPKTGAPNGALINGHDLRLLTWDRFEALLAVIFERMGRRVILTPRVGDQGIDVIAFDGEFVELIQCKHTQGSTPVDVDSVSELVSAFDSFRALRLKKLGSVKGVRLFLATNSKLTNRAKVEATRSDIQVLDMDSLIDRLKRWPCSHADLEIMSSKRILSMKNLEALLQRL